VLENFRPRLPLFLVYLAPGGFGLRLQNRGVGLSPKGTPAFAAWR